MRKKIISGLIIILICAMLTGCKSSDYKQASELQASGDYASAILIYESLGEYKDAVLKIQECNYNIAMQYVTAKDYKLASEYFDKANDYNDASSQKMFCEDMISSIELFEVAKEGLEQRNAELLSAISEAELLLGTEKLPLDDNLLLVLDETISQVKIVKVETSDMPEELEDIKQATDEMNKVNYDDSILKLSDAKYALELSIKQYALVNVPTEGYIIDCLGKVDNIIDIAAVTEENDPNGKLGKSGGYTAQIYFSIDLINQSDIKGSTVIDKGTDCGGSIEVYATVSDAVNRDAYLASFDGTIYASGSHYVIGTVVVRTSNELTASQQKDLETKIINELIKVE